MIFCQNNDILSMDVFIANIFFEIYSIDSEDIDVRWIQKMWWPQRNLGSIAHMKWKEKL